MQYIYLPGFSPHNSSELETFQEYFSEQDVDLITHTWAHWDNEDVAFDIEAEVERIAEKVDMQTLQDGYAIAAKSIGTLVAMHLIQKFQVHPTKVALMGIPVEDLDSPDINVYRRTLEPVEGDVFVIQNMNDPHGSLNRAQSLLKDVENVHFIVKQADHHEYPYVEDVWALFSR